MDRQEFLAIMESGDFDRLIGETESDWLECKGEFYSLKEDWGKRELAKDISSFANIKGGGFILVGVETEKSDKVQLDTIRRIRPFLQNNVDIEQYQNILKDWVYSTPVVNIEWKSYRRSNKGILVIAVPPQSEEVSPFLISKTIEQSGKLTEILFGYAERKRTNSQPKKLAKLHQIFRDGLFFGTNISRRFDEIATLLQRPSVSNTQPAKSNEEISIRITDAIMNGGLKGHRKLIIVAYTYEKVTLPAWSDSRSELIRILEEPPKLRRSGWDLYIGKRSKIIKGELRRSVDEGYKILDLYRDGTLIFGVIAERDYLTWGQVPNDLKINSLALIETVYNFVTLYKIITDNFTHKPSELFARIKLHDLHLNKEKSFMVPDAVGAISVRRYDAPDNDFDTIEAFDPNKFTLGSVAYEIVQEVYLWFGMDSRMIPYVNERNGVKEIDPAQFPKT